jgi:hypothetical protein
MDTIMKKNIAYKKTQGNNHYPDGTITDIIETDEDALDNYIVVPRDNFPKILEENVKYVSSYDPSKNPKPIISGAVAAPPSPPSNPPPNSDEVLFQQFMAWKASQGS